METRIVTAAGCAADEARHDALTDACVAHHAATSGSPTGENASLAGAILLAALALPGLAAHAETAPEQGQVSFKYLNYEDSQPGLNRIKVNSPSFSVLAPVAGVWAIEGSLTHDDVSGASPRYHTAISSASQMDDSRRAADFRVTRYFSEGSLTAGAAYSNEHDYLSRALSMQANLESDTKNTTWTVGLAAARDAINPVNLIVHDQKKNTREILLGMTQVLTQNDIALVNLTNVRGRGYFSDPYKLVDNRPRSRDENILTLRWNHHFTDSDGTSRLSYRWYKDSFGVRSQTLGAEYVQPFSGGWKLTPSVRWYSQSAADFYFDPVYSKLFGAPFPVDFKFGTGRFTSADQRLSAFGAVTLGLKLEKQLGADWLLDLKFEKYEQRTNWRMGADGSPGLDPLSARSIQIGLTKRW